MEQKIISLQMQMQLQEMEDKWTRFLELTAQTLQTFQPICDLRKSFGTELTKPATSSNNTCITSLQKRLTNFDQRVANFLKSATHKSFAQAWEKASKPNRPPFHVAPGPITGIDKKPVYGKRAVTAQLKATKTSGERYLKPSVHSSEINFHGRPRAIPQRPKPKRLEYAYTDYTIDTNLKEASFPSSSNKKRAIFLAGLLASFTPFIYFEVTDANFQTKTWEFICNNPLLFAVPLGIALSLMYIFDKKYLAPCVEESDFEALVEDDICSPMLKGGTIIFLAATTAALVYLPHLDGNAAAKTSDFFNNNLPLLIALAALALIKFGSNIYQRFKNHRNTPLAADELCDEAPSKPSLLKANLPWLVAIGLAIGAQLAYQHQELTLQSYKSAAAFIKEHPMQIGIPAAVILLIICASSCYAWHACGTKATHHNLENDFRLGIANNKS